MIFYNFTPCFEHFNIKLTNVSAFCTMSLLYVLLQLILRKLLVAAPPKTCHTPRAETPPSLIQPLAGLLPWLLCIIVVTRRQETGTSRPAKGKTLKTAGLLVCCPGSFEAQNGKMLALLALRRSRPKTNNHAPGTRDL